MFLVIILAEPQTGSSITSLWINISFFNPLYWDVHLTDVVLSDQSHGFQGNLTDVDDRRCLFFTPKLSLPNLIQKSSKFDQFTWFPKWMYEIKIIIWIFCKNINQKSWEYIKVTDDFWFYQNLTIIYGIFRHFHSAPYSSVNSQEKTMWDYETLHNLKICRADSRVSTL